MTRKHSKTGASTTQLVAEPVLGLAGGKTRGDWASPTRGEGMAARSLMPPPA